MAPTPKLCWAPLPIAVCSALGCAFAFATLNRPPSVVLIPANPEDSTRTTDLGACLGRFGFRTQVLNSNWPHTQAFWTCLTRPASKVVMCCSEEPQFLSRLVSHRAVDFSAPREHTASAAACVREFVQRTEFGNPIRNFVDKGTMTRLICVGASQWAFPRLLQKISESDSDDNFGVLPFAELDQDRSLDRMQFYQGAGCATLLLAALGHRRGLDSTSDGDQQVLELGVAVAKKTGLLSGARVLYFSGSIEVERSLYIPEHLLAISKIDAELSHTLAVGLAFAETSQETIDHYLSVVNRYAPAGATVRGAMCYQEPSDAAEVQRRLRDKIQDIKMWHG